MYKHFGCLSKLAMRYTEGPLIHKVTDTAEEIDGPLETPGSMTSSKSPAVDKSWIQTVINTEYGMNELHTVSCLNDSEFWTCGDDKSIRLYNLKGESLKQSKPVLGICQGTSQKQRIEILYLPLQ